MAASASKGRFGISRDRRDVVERSSDGTGLIVISSPTTRCVGRIIEWNRVAVWHNPAGISWATRLRADGTMTRVMRFADQEEADNASEAYWSWVMADPVGLLVRSRVRSGWLSLAMIGFAIGCVVQAGELFYLAGFVSGGVQGILIVFGVFLAIVSERSLRKARQCATDLRAYSIDADGMSFEGKRIDHWPWEHIAHVRFGVPTIVRTHTGQVYRIPDVDFAMMPLIDSFRSEHPPVPSQEVPDPARAHWLIGMSAVLASAGLVVIIQYSTASLPGAIRTMILVAVGLAFSAVAWWWEHRLIRLHRQLGAPGVRQGT